MPPSQDQMQQVITILGSVVDVLKLHLQQALIRNTSVQVEGPHQVAMQGMETPSSVASSSLKVKRPRIAGLPVHKEPPKRLKVQCWKCKECHYPRQCPQLRDKCYFCGNSEHKVGTCPKKFATTCYACGEKGHLARECPRRKFVAAPPFEVSGRPTMTRSGNRGGSSRRATSTMKGMRHYNFKGQ